MGAGGEGPGGQDGAVCGDGNVLGSNCSGGSVTVYVANMREMTTENRLILLYVNYTSRKLLENFAVKHRKRRRCRGRGGEPCADSSL